MNNEEQMFYENLILKINNAMLNNGIIKIVVLFCTEGHVIKSSRFRYKRLDYVNYVRHLKIKSSYLRNDYLNFENERDYNMYVLYKKLINDFLINNPDYKMAEDEFGIVKYCFSYHVYFNFVYEPKV